MNSTKINTNSGNSQSVTVINDALEPSFKEQYTLTMEWFPE